MKPNDVYLLHPAEADWSTLDTDAAVALIEAIPYERDTGDDDTPVFRDAAGRSLIAFTWLPVGIQIQVLSNQESEVLRLVEMLTTAMHRATGDDIYITEM